jgi:hypothetical protein
MKNKVAITIATLAVLAAASTAPAQQSPAAEIFRTAAIQSWTVRIITPFDTVQGRVVSVFRDTARVGGRRVAVSTVSQIMRRKGDSWELAWPKTPQASPPDTAPARGPTVYLFAGAAGALVPFWFGIPPIAITGLQFGFRDASGEFAVGARTIIWPAPMAIIAADLSRSFWSTPTTYAGFAVGGMMVPSELYMAPMVGARIGRTARGRSGMRSELRADAIVADGAAIIITMHLGVDQVIGNK